MIAAPSVLASRVVQTLASFPKRESTRPPGSRTVGQFLSLTERLSVVFDLERKNRNSGLLYALLD